MVTWRVLSRCISWSTELWWSQRRWGSGHGVAVDAFQWPPSESARRARRSMTAGPVSVKDVAARAGVSLGTVSNVLNRPERVASGTRAKVEKAIQELGFVRNEAARHLRAGHSRTIAYLVLDAANPFFTDVAKGVEDLARIEGWAMFLCNSDRSEGRRV